MEYPTLDQLDTETRVLLALDLLDRGDPLPSTTREVTEACGLAESITRTYLHRLRAVAGLVESSPGRGRASWRLNQKGSSRANQLRLLKPRQRLIFATLRRIGEGHYKHIAKASGLSPNGVSQSLPAMQDRGLVKPVYNTGRNGWVYAA